MGLPGFLLVLGWAQRHTFPRTLRRGLLVSVIYIVLAGLLAYQAIDNPAHFGGFTTGVILGMGLTRRHKVSTPDHVSPLLSYPSIVANAVILATTVVCLSMMLGM